MHRNRNRLKPTKIYFWNNNNLEDIIPICPTRNNSSDSYIRHKTIEILENNDEPLFDSFFDEQDILNIIINNDNTSSHDNQTSNDFANITNNTNLVENTDLTNNSNMMNTLISNYAHTTEKLNDENDSCSHVASSGQHISLHESSNKESALKNGIYPIFGTHKRFPKRYVIDLHDNHISTDLHIRKMEREERRNIGLYFKNFECKSSEILLYLKDNKDRLSEIFSDYNFKK